MPPQAPSDPDGSETTRRSLIVQTVAVMGMAGLAGSVLAPARTVAAGAKLSPSEIGYRPTPNGRSRCDGCVNWRPPDACKAVAGPISPSGWCALFVRKD